MPFVLEGSPDKSKITAKDVKLGQCFKMLDGAWIGSLIYKADKGYINLSTGAGYFRDNPGEAFLALPVEILPKGTKIVVN